MRPLESVYEISVVQFTECRIGSTRGPELQPTFRSLWIVLSINFLMLI
jgi:hypothetical protein